MQMISAGIYKITQRNTDKIYIGSTIRITHRWGSHISKLLSNTHENKSLQDDFNRYGLSSLSFEIVEFLPFSTRKEVLSREKYWFNIFISRGEQCYNITRFNPLPPSDKIYYCTLCNNPEYNTYNTLGYLDLIKSSPGSPYHLSLWGGVWRRDLLRDVLIPGETAQQIELNGTHRLSQKGDEVLVLGTRQAPMRHANVIQANDWNKDVMVGLPALTEGDREELKGLGYL